MPSNHPRDLEIDEMLRRVSFTPKIRAGQILQYDRFQYRASGDSYMHSGVEVVDVVNIPNEGPPITRNSVRLFNIVQAETPKKGGLTAFLAKHS
jgi:hypothetical protein